MHSNLPVWTGVLLLLLVAVPVSGAIPYATLYDSQFASQGSSALYNKDAYAWGESYVMMSLTRMYQVTENTKYLESLVSHARVVFGKRDSVTNTVDYRGRALPAWGTSRYSGSPDKHYVWAVHTGMITYPIARFVRLVYENEELQPRYKGAADQFLSALKAAVAVHDEEFVNGPGVDEGYYSMEAAWNIVGISVATAPFNQQNALGRTLLELYLITKDQVYLDKVTRLANFQRNRIFAMPDGSYVWMYHLPPSVMKGPLQLSVEQATKVAPNVEDTSHAAINVDFMVEAYKAGIVFTESDMKALVKTVLGRLFDSEGKVCGKIGGVGEKDNTQAKQIGEWLGLAQFSAELTQKIEKYYGQGSPGLDIVARLAQADQYWHHIANK